MVEWMYGSSKANTNPGVPFREQTYKSARQKSPKAVTTIATDVDALLLPSHPGLGIAADRRLIAINQPHGELRGTAPSQPVYLIQKLIRRQGAACQQTAEEEDGGDDREKGCPAGGLPASVSHREESTSNRDLLGFLRQPNLL